jgi:hypothetical protein
MASVMTEAKIGPTQGVHKRPIDKPMARPPTKPELFCVFGTSEVRWENNFSKNNWN